MIINDIDYGELSEYEIEDKFLNFKSDEHIYRDNIVLQRCVENIRIEKIARPSNYDVRMFPEVLFGYNIGDIVGKAKELQDIAVRYAYQIHSAPECPKKADVNVVEWKFKDVNENPFIIKAAYVAGPNKTDPVADLMVLTAGCTDVDDYLGDSIVAGNFKHIMSGVVGNNKDYCHACMSDRQIPSELLFEVVGVCQNSDMYSLPKNTEEKTIDSVIYETNDDSQGM